MSATRDLPLTIVAGYLGSGKTTLINRLLAGKAQRRVAVLINDFGSLNIDAALIDSVSERTIALTNGCICCLLGDDLGRALEEVLAVADQLDHVVLEASGVADGSRLSAQVLAWPGFALRGIITLADATRIRTLAADKYVGKHILHQLAAANWLLLTHLDLCPDREVAQLREWLAMHTCAAVQTLADLDWDQLAMVGRSPTAVPSAAGNTHPGLQSVTFFQRRPISRVQFTRWCELNGRHIARAKGWLNFAEDPDRTYLLQMSGDRVKLEPNQLPGAETLALVIIAADLERIADPFVQS
jgi:G3E family GTPase